MDKQTMLKEFYRAEINALIDETSDAVLLDLIHRLLTKENDKNKGEEKC